MTEYTVRPVRVEEFLRNGDTFVAYFRSAMAHGTHDCSVNHILNLIKDGLYLPWGVYHNPTAEQHGAFATVIRRYELRKSCRIVLLGGEKLGAWLPVIFAEVEKYGRTNGCDFLEAEGRKGWARLLEKYGVREAFRTFTKDLD